jgi:hypothetical protein
MDITLKTFLFMAGILSVIVGMQPPRDQVKTMVLFLGLGLLLFVIINILQT